MNPLWAQFEALIPPVIDTHPLGCHRPRVSDRVVFDKLVQVLVLGVMHEKIADTSGARSTAAAGLFSRSVIVLSGTKDSLSLHDPCQSLYIRPSYVLIRLAPSTRRPLRDNAWVGGSQRCT